MKHSDEEILYQIMDTADVKAHIKRKDYTVFDIESYVQMCDNCNSWEDSGDDGPEHRADFLRRLVEAKYSTPNFEPDLGLSIVDGTKYLVMFEL